MTKLIVQLEHLAQIRTHAQQVYPEECCGLLLGHNEPRRLIEVVPVENSWGEESAKMLEDGLGGESSPVFVHPDAGSGGTLSCRFPAGNSDRRCCEDFVLDGAFKGRKSIPPTAPPVPVEEEVRIPKVRVLGFPQDESAVGFPRNESAVELAREEREEQTRTSSGFSRSANPKGSKRNRFSIDPQAMLQVQKAARARHLDIIGIYHSHPDNPAVPSEFDRAIAWSSYSYIIVSVEQGQATDLNSWTLDEDRQFQPEEILIIDSKLSKS